MESSFQKIVEKSININNAMGGYFHEKNGSYRWNPLVVFAFLDFNFAENQTNLLDYQDCRF